MPTIVEVHHLLWFRILEEKERISLMGNHGNEFLGLANTYALAVCLVQLAKVGDSLIRLQISFVSIMPNS